MQYQPYPQGQYPLIDGEGFVTRKYAEPSEKQLELNGRVYHVVVYKTGLTGVKPGKLELQSATQSFLVSTPFGMRNTPGFIDPTEAFQQQVIDVKTNGASIEIKPLPSVGRPPTFSGAVGDFTLATSAEPPKARTGDPVSLKVEIKGLGNFDRIEQPALIGTAGMACLPRLGGNPIVRRARAERAENLYLSSRARATGRQSANSRIFLLRSECRKICHAEVIADQNRDQGRSTARVGEFSRTVQRGADATERSPAYAGRARYSDAIAGPGFISSLGSAAVLLDRSNDSSRRASVARPWILGPKSSPQQSTAAPPGSREEVAMEKN